MPPAHATHSALELAPAATVDEPAGQPRHALDSGAPAAAENEPTGHGVHAAADAAPAAGEKEPGAHAVQAAAPARLYVPAAHCAGAYPAAQKNPRGQGAQGDAPPLRP